MVEQVEYQAPTSGGTTDADGNQIPDPRRALVKEWGGKIRDAKTHHEDAFKRMREDMDYARLGQDKTWVAAGNYTVPIIMRHVNQSVATLYAKNPVAVAKRRKRLMYQIWDGKVASLQSALGNPMAPGAMDLLMEIETVKQQTALQDRIGKTLEILFQYFIDEQGANFKVQAKQLIRRVKVCGVGYIWLSYQRLMEPQPDITAQINDVTSKIAVIERLTEKMQKGDLQETEAEIERLRLNLQDLQADEMIIVREGPVFDFPKAHEIIIDPKCTQIPGFIGAGWIAREYHKTADEVKEIWKVDLGKNYTTYRPDTDKDPNSKAHDPASKQSLCCIWQVWNKVDGQTFTICDGYPDFLEEPATPKSPTERFWPAFPLVFNDIEAEGEIYPPSDVNILRHPQKEYNSARQGLREHRQANRPKYFTLPGMLSDKDKENLQTAPAHAVIELHAAQPGFKIDELIQKHTPVAIDPAMYETQSAKEDILLSVGAQQADIGGTSGASATETSIAESRRTANDSSNVDDLDEVLTDLAHATGQMMLLNLDAKTVTEIAGPGAVWPDLTREEINKDIYLTIKAGSSGKPNRAAELANLERGMPFLVQMPGLNPTVLGQKYAELLEFDTEDLLVEGLPSITAMNAMAGKQAQMGTGDPANDPNAQGGQGAANAPAPDQIQGGPQPAYPAGASAVNFTADGSQTGIQG